MNARTRRLQRIGATIAAVVSIVTAVAKLITDYIRRPYEHKSLSAEELAADIKIDDSTREWLQTHLQTPKPETPLEPTDHKKAMEDWQKFAASVRAMTPPPAPKAGTPEPPLER